MIKTTPKMDSQATITKPAAPAGQKISEVMPFKSTLARYQLELVRNSTHTLQINLGFLCNQNCRHCHLDAGPGRTENMGAATLAQVLSYARRSHFETIDITGGAPELNPHLVDLIERVSPLAPRIMLRSNLSALKAKMDRLLKPLQAHRVVIVASFPSLNMSQADSQRGDGIFKESIETLQALGHLYTSSGTEFKVTPR